MFGSRDESKNSVAFVVAANPLAVERGVKAGNLVKTLGQYIDGRGGGKPELAQGSGTKPEGLKAGFEAIAEELENL